ncbi:NADH-quinone oxidoreductase subunit M [Candidatus Paracaedibacter acanthamoebae]|uniref:NADH-quinone oxidoreductase chain 13 n=1 Tax=Candidatus Odyssella acanthamoebae TaxID=91604 RepID=A0A077B0K6_9PROT|nr:NADH-quinone oxidoreductase chain 13 [Candidatus Paracaedibacter acanthamoebae]
MLEELPILSLTTFFPLFGALFILLIKGDEATIARNSRYVALWSSVLTFVLSLLIYIGFDPLKPGDQFVEHHTWVKEFNISYHMGVDGFSILFILLSTFLMPLCILASWESIQKRVREYMLAFLLLETLMIGMFCALDLILFYVFFEGVLIPMFLIIGIWGGERRIYSCFKFFLYTFLGSVFMLLAIIAIYVQVGTTDLTAVHNHTFSANLQHWLWLAFFASFAVKVPMWPVHTWLPDAHVEAPTAGSVILAGVLLKMGGYGFLRFSVPLFPEANLTFAPYVMSLSVIAVVYASLVALVQKDMKKLIAYSSVAHMGFVTLGIFAMTPQAVTGAMIQMLSHGLISAALFLCVGVVYDRLHTREISRYGGLVAIMPVYAAFFMLFTMASVGLPGTSGFVGEFLVILGSFKVSTVFATLAATGMILGAAYALWLYRRVVFGKLEHADLQSLKDLNWRESFSFAVLGIAVLWMGIYPKTFTDIINPSVDNLIAQYTRKLAQAQKVGQLASADSVSQVRES